MTPKLRHHRKRCTASTPRLFGNWKRAPPNSETPRHRRRGASRRICFGTTVAAQGLLGGVHRHRLHPRGSTWQAAAWAKLTFVRFWPVAPRYIPPAYFMPSLPRRRPEVCDTVAAALRQARQKLPVGSAVWRGMLCVRRSAGQTARPGQGRWARQGDGLHWRGSQSAFGVDVPPKMVRALARTGCRTCKFTVGR